MLHIPVVVSLPGYAPRTFGENVSRLERHPVVTGVVRGAKASTCVRMFTPHGLEHWWATDEKGRFRIWSLPAGAARLTRGCQFEGARVVELELMNGVTTTVELP